MKFAFYLVIHSFHVLNINMHTVHYFKSTTQHSVLHTVSSEYVFGGNLDGHFLLCFNRSFKYDTLQTCVEISGGRGIEHHKVDPLRSGSTSITSTPEVSHLSSPFYSQRFCPEEVTILMPWNSFAKFLTLYKENHACTLCAWLLSSTLRFFESPLCPYS